MSMLPKPYYEGQGVTIYCGKMEDIVPHLEPVDAVVTDPPYNETSLEWDRWVPGWPGMVLGLSNCLWCFGSMRMFWKFRDDFAGWELAQDVVWEKHNGSGSAADRFRRVHELALQFYQGPWGSLHKAVPTYEGRPVLHKRRSKPSHWREIGEQKVEMRSTRLERSVIYQRSMHGSAVNETQKPEGIVAPLLAFSVPEGGVVLDCFGGSGTTAVVARQQGKRAILIEARRSQCEEMLERLRGTLAL
jgi:site-specific DNA-methyltransferase (adenine-specific)